MLHHKQHFQSTHSKVKRVVAASHPLPRRTCAPVHLNTSREAARFLTSQVGLATLVLSVVAPLGGTVSFRRLGIIQRFPDRLQPLIKTLHRQASGARWALGALVVGLAGDLATGVAGQRRPPLLQNGACARHVSAARHAHDADAERRAGGWDCCGMERR